MRRKPWRVAAPATLVALLATPPALSVIPAEARLEPRCVQGGPPAGPNATDRPSRGATHVAEIPYMFDNLPRMPWTDAGRRLADTFFDSAYKQQMQGGTHP